MDQYPATAFNQFIQSRDGPFNFGTGILFVIGQSDMPIPNTFRVSVLNFTRYIQDPGSMTNNIEVPTRGFEMVVSRLATRLIREIPDADQSAPTSYFGLMAKQQRIDMLEKDAVKAEMLFWAEERTRAPIRLMPDISCYTR